MTRDLLHFSEEYEALLLGSPQLEPLWTGPAGGQIETIVFRWARE